MTKVELKNVSRVYLGQSGPVYGLSGFDLSIREGEFVCIVGSSGCGKTTLLNIVAGFEPPDLGEVLIDGEKITGPGMNRFVMFQEHALFPWLNVSQNIMFGLKMAGIHKSERRERAASLLKTVDLADFSTAWIHELSGGMKQRVALARALIMDPEILLMDEPFAALDSQTRDMLHEEVEQLWQRTRKTIIFVTHNVREAVRLGTRVILMTAKGGKILREYPIELPRNRFLEDVEVVKIASQIRDDLRHEVLRAAREEGYHAD
ncbi:MAG: ABC transporter ATP-binding protein [Deltaproteobacteria bacterium]